MMEAGTQRGLRRLPHWINVAYLSGVEDTTNHRGDFSLGVAGHGRCGSLTDNCSAMVNPTRRFRGSAPEVSERVWLGSLLLLSGACGNQIQEQCNYGGGGLSPEEWGRNAAASLERIILRYRLDGLGKITKSLRKNN